MKKLAFFLIAGLMFTGCAHRAVVKTTPDHRESVTEKKDTGAETKKSDETNSKKSPGENVSEKSMSADELAMKKLKELESAVQDIHFEYDKYSIRESDKPDLKKISRLLANNKVKVIVEGNCDERGTSEYNLALGDRRANEAKKYLESLGISANRLETVSYGAERPVCKEKNDVCWSKNRRDHFVFAAVK